jgi:uncharacterized membrane protein YgaE (UPF0421/DUF939 family)
VPRPPFELRVTRLRSQALLLVQAAVAATAAWAVATEVLSHHQPIFAPLSALIAIGATHGQRTRRVVELVLGVAIGIAVADLVVSAIGAGIWQLGLVVLLAMCVAVLLGSGPLLLTQTAVSAMLVVTTQPPGSGLDGARFVDALLGGAVALATASLLPANPLKAVRDAAAPVLEQLRDTLSDLVSALDGADVSAAHAALRRARTIDEDGGRWREAIRDGREIARSSPPRRGARDELQVHARVAAQMDLVVRNVRVLARAVVRAVELDQTVPATVRVALEELACAMGRLAGGLTDPDDREHARRNALRAAAFATAALEEDASLATSVIVGQIRSTASDVLVALGRSDAEARLAVRAAGVHGAHEPA